MTSFLNRSFCTAYGKYCGNNTCYRAMTKERHAAAAKWAGDLDYIPIMYADFGDGCNDIKGIEIG